MKWSTNAVKDPTIMKQRIVLECQRVALSYPPNPKPWVLRAFDGDFQATRNRAALFPHNPPQVA